LVVQEIRVVEFGLKPRLHPLFGSARDVRAGINVVAMRWATLYGASEVRRLTSLLSSAHVCLQFVRKNFRVFCYEFTIDMLPCRICYIWSCKPAGL